MNEQEQVIMRSEDEVNISSVDSDAGLMSTIKKLKETTVSREEFEKVLRQRDEITDAYVNGKAVSYLDDKINSELKNHLDPVDFDKLMNAWRTEQTDNYTYWKRGCQLRDEAKRLGKGDPFLPDEEHGNLIVTDEMRNQADKVYNWMQEAFEECDNNPYTFNLLYQSQVIDPILAPQINKRR